MYSLRRLITNKRGRVKWKPNSKRPHLQKQNEGGRMKMEIGIYDVNLR